VFEWLFKYPRHAYDQGELVLAGDFGVLWWAVAVLLLALSIVFGQRPAWITRLGSFGGWARRDRGRSQPKADEDSQGGSGALAGWSLVRRVPIHLLQLAAIAVILVLIAQPVLEVTRLAPGVNTVAVLVDGSRSMGLPAGPGSAVGSPSRLDVAKNLVGGAVREASGESKTALFAFGDGLARVESSTALRPEGDRTRVVDALTDLATSYDHAALAAIVVLTDGAQNAGDSTELETLAAAGIPVHPVGIGPVSIRGDVELLDLSIPPRTAPDIQVSARLAIRHNDADEVRVRVLQGESVLATETIALDPGTPVVTRDIEFASGSEGLKEVTVELEPSVPDPLPGNNARSRLFEVGGDRYRVLYLEGEPRWEFKFIRRAAAEDDDIDLVSWLRTTPRKTYRQGTADPDQLRDGFPASREALYRYDLVVIGSLPATALDDEQHEWLAAFVAERGGSLLALAGRKALGDGGWDVKPLANALPVILERPDPDAPPTYAAGEYRVRPTADGLRSVLGNIGGEPDRHEQNWETLPMLADYQRLGSLKPGATTLIEALGDVYARRGADIVVRAGTAVPLLVTQVYGYGHCAVLATASTWRWQMRTPPDDTRHAVFWRQLIRHLAGSALPRQRLSLAVEGDTLDVRVGLKDSRFEPVDTPALAARITPPEGEAFEVDLPRIPGEGSFADTISVSGPGIYRVDVATGDPGDPDAGITPLTARADGLKALARVGMPNLEQFGAALNEPLLRRIAEATGGQFWRPDDLGGLGDALAFGSAGIQERQQLPLWDAPILYLLLILLKCVEWSLRRYWGGI